ncbi:Protein CBG27353 [Caenorhabditis briggsae]|uniref:Protein CBG27353 n=1 Tax=Caenorhabditis briggsae TaxID=6238 RepID=B6IGF3_CAEBR|nr:Protein CBG27353 [Caenorhabditis briggsae]CAR98983.1 Protein CBG27353 [Caenorhabditis briggsae]
MNLLFQFEK